MRVYNISFNRADYNKKPPGKFRVRGAFSLLLRINAGTVSIDLSL